MLETQDNKSPQGLGVKPQLLIRREKEGAVFSSNEYGILGSFWVFFKHFKHSSTQQCLQSFICEEPKDQTGGTS